ncbi:uncharacterized protein [Nicotiana tomentosiformis]|uniref:uncharacterized protein n=1 Tax=Nicotiana tomentosiformis TaxID=4098 RepID=UPI00388C75E0
MTVIPPEVMTHKLNEDPLHLHVKQKKRKQGAFKNQVIQDELKIDPLDEKNTSFIIDMGTYCYIVMPFGLKNVGATYQRLVTKIFQEHLGKIMEVYMDDMLVKSTQAGRGFEILYKYNMKLIPGKCAFGVTSVLKKQNQFEWTDECQQDLKDLKTYLPNPHLLEKPKDGERLLIYLAVSEVACHPISVITVFPLRNILHKHELSGRLAKSATELSEYDIIYQPRTAIKSQVLTDFVADFSPNLVPEAEKELQIFTGANLGTWTLFTDGSSNVKGAGLGIVLIPPSGEIIRQEIKYYPITNNEAEYEVVIPGLELARELGIEQIVIKSDSQLVANQMQGTYVARETRM